MKEIKILSITKDKNKYLLKTDEDEYHLDEDTIVKFYLFKDKVITEEELQEILNYYHQNNYFNQAIRYLSYEMRSIYEVKKYLIDKGLNDVDIEVILNRLESLGYLDDEKYAENYYDYCLRNDKGPLYIKAKLEEKKVPIHIIDKIILKYNEDIEHQTIEKLITKEARKIKTYPLIKQRQRLLTKLVQNGFNKDLIYEVINNFQLLDESDERLNLEYQKLLSKYQKKDLSPNEVRSKIINALLSKGYEYQKILGIIE
ncbi:MAG TPA: RecX family transcriptional regulator [Bacilli bacterium]